MLWSLGLRRARLLLRQHLLDKLVHYDRPCVWKIESWRGGRGEGGENHQIGSHTFKMGFSAARSKKQFEPSFDFDIDGRPTDMGRTQEQILWFGLNRFNSFHARNRSIYCSITYLHTITSHDIFSRVQARYLPPLRETQQLVPKRGGFARRLH